MLATRKRAAPKRDRGDEFADFTPRPRAPAKGSPELKAALDSIATLPVTPRKPAPKVQGRKQQAIRDAAQGEPCTVRLVGVCNHRPETSVWAHWPGLDGDRGMGLKSIDLAGAIACFSCHDVIDMRAKAPDGMTREQVELAFFRGHLRSLVRLKQKGLL